MIQEQDIRPEHIPEDIWLDAIKHYPSNSDKLYRVIYCLGRFDERLAVLKLKEDRK